MNRTVIIPAYKAGWCMAECLESIYLQTVAPNRILIGCDACEESAEKALELKKKYARKCRAKNLLISVYYFPRHVGPYRIRNTLALNAAQGALLFFDADDLMYKSFIDMMTKTLTADRFLYPQADKIDMDTGELESWNRAHGIVAIERQTFIMHGGFEGWKCAADTEAHARWEAGGLNRCTTKDSVMLVRKHKAGLTMNDETGYQSVVRKDYMRELVGRRLKPVRLGHIDIADCHRITSMDETGMEGKGGHIEAITQRDILKEGTGGRDAVGCLRRLVSVSERGFEQRQRQAYDAAVKLLKERR